MEKKETDYECACREVREEVGLDIAGKIDEEYMEDEANVHVFNSTFKKPIKLYIVPYISEEAQFVTTSNYEITGILWAPISIFTSAEHSSFNSRFPEYMILFNKLSIKKCSFLFKM